MEQKTNWLPVATIGILILVIALVVIFNNKPKEASSIKVGMIVPLSGSAADYGIQMRGGAEIAKQELFKMGVDVNLIIEDSKADTAIGISAYRKLVDIDKVDYIISSFTRVSLPLIEMTAKDKIPMIMTIFAGDWDKTKSPYVIRFFPTPRQYVRGEDGENVLKGVKTASVIYVNDDYGKSVLKELELFLAEKDIKLLTQESYTPSSSDFRTALTKIKFSNPEILSVISSSPVEISNIIKQSNEIGIAAKLFDSSITLSNPNVYKNPNNNIEGVITKATLAEIKDKSPEALNFFAEYYKNNNKDPYFAALFGYESVKLVSNIEQKNGREDLSKAVNSLLPLKTIFGDISVSDYQEINPTIVNVEVKDGSLIPVR